MQPVSEASSFLIQPKGYLTQWSMMPARRALREQDKPLAALVGELGYGSESAFSHAFKREVGISPAEYRRRARHDPAWRQQVQSS